MEYTPYAPRTPEDLRALSSQHQGIRVISQLETKELRSSASNWNIRHLITYRLLVRPELAFLPVFKPDHDGCCPVCDQEESCQQKIRPSGLQRLAGETPHDLCAKTEGELMELPDGFFWVALARAARSDHAGNQVRVHPQRERKQVERQDFTSSTSAIQGSSSPVAYSSSEFDADMNDDIDEDEHEARRNKPEEVTVHLIINFLQHVLHLCLVQSTADRVVRSEVRPRVERKTSRTSIAGTALVAAEDDGGICKMTWGGHGWAMEHPYLALLEAKRTFRHVSYDEKMERYSPVVSNENLAQYLGEAVITWKANRELLLHGVFLIAATNAFVRFVHFAFGRDYQEYVDARSREAQMEIIDDEEKDAFVYMQSTKWFNLQSREGRRVALCHVLALLRWHEAQDSQQYEAGGSVGEDSDHNSGPESAESAGLGSDDDYMDTEE